MTVLQQGRQLVRAGRGQLFDESQHQLLFDPGDLLSLACLQRYIAARDHAVATGGTVPAEQLFEQLGAAGPGTGGPDRDIEPILEGRRTDRHTLLFHPLPDQRHMCGRFCCVATVPGQVPAPAWQARLIHSRQQQARAGLDIDPHARTCDHCRRQSVDLVTHEIPSTAGRR